MFKKQTLAEKREQRWAYLMIAPTIIGLLVLNYYPLFDTIRLSFSRTQTFGKSTFNGIENYVTMFSTPMNSTPSPTISPSPSPTLSKPSGKQTARLRSA